MKGYELSPEAAADKLEEDIYAACELLAKNPRLGHRRSDLTDEPVLFWPVRGQYVVIYLPDTEPLKIVRILQGAPTLTSSPPRSVTGTLGLLTRGLAGSFLIGAPLMA
jgi:plasmid stabilization system protein ParE